MSVGEKATNWPKERAIWLPLLFTLRSRVLGGHPVPAAFMSETWTEGGADFWAIAWMAWSVAVAWVRTGRERRRVVRNFMMGERSVRKLNG